MWVIEPRMRWAGHTERMGVVHRVLVEGPEGKRPFGRPSCRWENNIRMDPIEVGWRRIGWIGLAQDRDKWRVLVNAVMNLWVPYNAGNFF
jgi:hypothetical protein